MDFISTKIISHAAHFYKFKREGSTWVCNVCYWRGEITPADEGFTATAEQKYEPRTVYTTQHPTEKAAFDWVASMLEKDPA